MIWKQLKLNLLNKNINKILVNTNSLRVPIKKNKIKKLEGSKVVKVSRRGKYLLIATNKNYTLLIHLGMSGRLIYKKKKYISNKHEHVVFILYKNLCSLYLKTCLLLNAFLNVIKNEHEISYNIFVTKNDYFFFTYARCRRRLPLVKTNNEGEEVFVLPFSVLAYEYLF